MIERFPSYKQASEFARELAISEKRIIRMQSGEDGFYYVATNNEPWNLCSSWNHDWHEQYVASWKYAPTRSEPSEYELSPSEYYYRMLGEIYYEEGGFFGGFR